MSGAFGIFVGVNSVPATGYTLINNEANGFVADIFLDDTSSLNTVIATDFVTSVADLGMDNTLIGTLAMINNPGIPDDVQQQLEELRDMLGPP